MKKVFIEKHEDLRRIVIADNDIIEEIFIEENDLKPVPGEIYKGIVKNVVPAIKSAFIDIGKGKNAYLYIDSKFKNTKIKKNDEIIVEIIKEDLDNKGPKVTNAFSIPGRFVVIQSLNNDIVFSQKITDENFKNQLKNQLIKPEDCGIMVRTNAQDADIKDINIEIQKLYNIYKEILNKSKYIIKPQLLYSDEGILDRILRNINADECCIISNDVEDFNYIKAFYSNYKKVNVELILHNEDRTLLDYYGLEKEILSLKNNKVFLPCGGYLLIDRTEAMYVIDVNSGKNVSSSSIDKTALITNIQAAKEAARQIKLRNLSGIIVIDFIDMVKETDKKEVMDTLIKAFENDKNKTTVYPFTELNLVQIARRRRGKSINYFLEEKCNLCHGKGYRIKYDYIKIQIRNEIFKLNKQNFVKDIFIEINEAYRNDIQGDIIGFIKDISALDKRVYVDYSEKVETFKIEPLIFANQIENMQLRKIYG